MKLQYPIRNSQSQAVTHGLVRTGFVDAVETLKKVGDLIRRYSDTGVDDFYAQVSIARGNGDLNSAAFIGEFDRVFNQIFQDTLNHGDIAFDEW